MKYEYSWISNAYNDNVYVLLFIILILSFIIYNFNFWQPNPVAIYKNSVTKTTSQNLSKSQFNNISSHEKDYAHYQAPTETNLSNNLFISDEEKAHWKLASEILDGNDESLQNTNGSPNIKNPINDILQMNSTLFGNSNSNGNGNSNNLTYTENYATVGDYATLDSVGKGLTDTLGGINTSLGFTLLDEQLGTFNKKEIPNPHAYDNTSNYYTGMNANTVDGASLYGNGLKYLQNNKPVFLQKDFDGVANIFAPNIVIQNPPLTKDGYPDISIRM